MNRFLRVGNLAKSVLTLLLCAVSLVLPVKVMSDTPKIGIVIMHGKGGSPTKTVSELAGALEKKGYLVANLEMPWSGNREYDASVTAAEEQVEAALSSLRGKGAQKVFVAGHSQGGVFTLHFAGKHAVDGIICIAPGGSVASQVFREKLGNSVARARQMVAEGKGDEKSRFDDHEGKKGTFSVVTTAAVYLTWFDPEGAMNSKRAAAAVNPQIPILWIVAQRDYPGLRKTNIPLFDTFPKNSQTRLFEPNADHIGAPYASIGEIARWTAEVASTGR